MNPFVFAVRRPFTTLMLTAALAGGAVFGLSKMHVVDLSRIDNPRVHTYTEKIVEKAKQAKEYAVKKYEAYFGEHEEEVHHEPHKVVVTSPKAKNITITQQYVCQIHSQRHIEVCALKGGYLQQILVKEGQAVKKGDLMFKILPVLYQAQLDAELAEANLAELEVNYAKKLSEANVVSAKEVPLHQARLAKALAKAQLARAELKFTDVTAPFDGIVDRQLQQLGSLIKEGDLLTTLSDNSVMWVYFNVPEARYLEYMAGVKRKQEDPKIELELANGEKYEYPGKIGAIEANFNNQTGNIAFRADFPNTDDRLLRHGQTGNILIHRVQPDSLVIPQRATFQVLHKRYVYVVDKEGIAHQREILVQNEMDDIFVLKDGLGVGDKIVLEGTRQVHDGEKVAYEFSPPELVMTHLKNRAE